MGIFSGLFKKEPDATTFDTSDEAIRAYFKKKEELAWQWPSKEYDTALGVYLDGNLLYQQKVNGHYRSAYVTLSDLVDHKKAAELCRAAMDPANVKAMRKKFGRQWGDPSGAMRVCLAVISPDEAERERYLREMVLENNHLAYYVYRNWMVSRYCRTTEEKLRLYDMISCSPRTVSEQEGIQPSGLEHWIKWELYHGDDCNTRRKKGLDELRKMLRSPNPEVKKAAAQCLKAQQEREKLENDAMKAEYYALYEFAQDELRMQLVDQNDKKVKLRNGKITEMKD